MSAIAPYLPNDGFNVKGKGATGCFGTIVFFRRQHVRFLRDLLFLKPFSVMPRELDRVGVARQNKRPPLIKSAGCCLMLDPHYSSSNMYLGDEGTYVCKAFSPRSYVIQKVCVC